MPDPGWVRDPSGRYQQRYFDGTRWTEHVADEYGRRSTDPVENAQRPAAPAAPAAPIAPAGYATPGTALAPYQPAAPAAAGREAAGDVALEISARSIVGVAGGLVALIGITLMPWFEDLRIGQAGGAGAGAGVLKASYFESGWIVSIVAVFVAVATSVRTTSAAPRWLASIPVGVCAVWAVVSTVAVKSDLTGVSFGFGFFVALLGLVAATIAPLLPGSTKSG